MGRESNRGGRGEGGGGGDGRGKKAMKGNDGCRWRGTLDGCEIERD